MLIRVYRFCFNMNQKKDGQEITTEKLYPNFTKEQLIEAGKNLDDYLSLFYEFMNGLFMIQQPMSSLRV